MYKTVEADFPSLLLSVLLPAYCQIHQNVGTYFDESIPALAHTVRPTVSVFPDRSSQFSSQMCSQETAHPPSNE